MILWSIFNVALWLLNPLFLSFKSFSFRKQRNYTENSFGSFGDSHTKCLWCEFVFQAENITQIPNIIESIFILYIEIAFTKNKSMLLVFWLSGFGLQQIIKSKISFLKMFPKYSQEKGFLRMRTFLLYHHGF